MIISQIYSSSIGCIAEACILCACTIFFSAQSTSKIQRISVALESSCCVYYTQTSIRDLDPVGRCMQCITSFPGSSPAFLTHTVPGWGGAWERGYAYMYVCRQEKEFQPN